jgi:ubiquinone/menaquinone biosynthesis C-methylase UbiE
MLGVSKPIITYYQEGVLMPHPHTAVPATEGNLIRWATFYDAFVTIATLGKSKSLRAQTADLAAIQPGEQVLDVGCGTGELTMLARQRTGARGTVVGLDASPEMIAVARRKAERAHLAIDYRVAVIETIPFPDNTFDVVLSSLMMHHLPDELKQAGLLEIQRVLKPGGRVVLVDLKGNTAPTIHHLPLGWFHHGVEKGIEYVGTLLEQSGFKHVEQSTMALAALGYARGYK